MLDFLNKNNFIMLENNEFFDEFLIVNLKFEFLKNCYTLYFNVHRWGSKIKQICL